MCDLAKCNQTLSPLRLPSWILAYRYENSCKITSFYCGIPSEARNAQHNFYIMLDESWLMLVICLSTRKNMSSLKKRDDTKTAQSPTCRLCGHRAFCATSCGVLKKMRMFKTKGKGCQNKTTKALFYMEIIGFLDGSWEYKHPEKGWHDPHLQRFWDGQDFSLNSQFQIRAVESITKAPIFRSKFEDKVDLPRCNWRPGL